MQAILEVFQERRPVDDTTIVERQTEVLGEGALPRAIEAGDPDTDLVLAPGFHRQLHLGEQVVELLLDVLGDDILRDFRLESVLLRDAVGDDLLDGSGDVFTGIEERTDRHGLVLAISNRLAAYVDGTIAAVLPVEAQELQASCTSAHAWVQKHCRHMYLALDLAFDGTAT